MPKLLISTGPQGSGNHLFSKIFALHKDVYGWNGLLDTYWEGHHLEPFAKYWKDPELLQTFDWTQSKYYVTSISCPYFANGEPCIPDYQKFIEIAQQYCDIEVVMIGRDQNILEFQQQRLRNQHTTPIALDAFKFLFDNFSVHFLSQELVYLYKEQYLNIIEKLLHFPIATSDPRLTQILQNDANKKYIKSIDESWLDKEVFTAMKES